MIDSLSQDGLHEGGTDDAADAFLKNWTKDADQPSDRDEELKKKPRSTPEADDDLEDDSDEGLEDDQDDAGDEDTDDEDEDEGKEPKAKTLAGDDAEVEIKVGEEIKKVSVKDLKRLYGQEAALTQKSQEVAARRTKVEEVGTYHVTALNTLLDRAKKAYEPYANIDFALAAKDLDADTYNALKQEALSAYENVKYLENDLGNALNEARTQRTQVLQEEAKLTLKNLTDPEKGIKGFNAQVYDEMRAHAVSMGVPINVINDVVSEPIIRLFHDAYMFHKGKSVKTVKKDTKGKKIIKTSSNSSTNDGAKNKSNTAMKKLRQTGQQDDAVNAFLEKWKS